MSKHEFNVFLQHANINTTNIKHELDDIRTNIEWCRTEYDKTTDEQVRRELVARLKI